MKIRIIPEIMAGKMSSVTLAASLCIAFTVNSATAGSIERISVDSGNIQFNYASPLYQALSSDGRYVVFIANITSGSSSQTHAYLRDRATGTTEVVSVGNDGSNGQTSGAVDVSDDGRYVLFTSGWLDGNNNSHVYVRDRTTGTTELISVANDGSPDTVGNSPGGASISGNGRYVTFVSGSPNIVSGDTNSEVDVFVRDRVTATTQRVNITSDGTQANGNDNSVGIKTNISKDGRYVVFNSPASNLVPNDTNGKSDIFIHDRINGTTVRINLTNDGAQSIAHDDGFDLSSDGRYLVFASFDSNLVANDSNGQNDIFVRDLVMGTTELVSIADDGSQANLASFYPGISANGRYVSFNSSANNLVTGGTPQGLAIFVRDRVANTTKMVDTPHDGSTANYFSFGNSAVSGDGRYIMFGSGASNLVVGDSDVTNNWDIFIHDSISGQVCQ